MNQQFAALRNGLREQATVKMRVETATRSYLTLFVSTWIEICAAAYDDTEPVFDSKMVNPQHGYHITMNDAIQLGRILGCDFRSPALFDLLKEKLVIARKLFPSQVGVVRNNTGGFMIVSQSFIAKMDK